MAKKVPVRAQKKQIEVKNRLQHSQCPFDETCDQIRLNKMDLTIKKKMISEF